MVLLFLCVVSMSVVRPEYGLNQYRRLVVSLSVLAFILLAVDIGLGVYCKSLCNLIKHLQVYIVAVVDNSH